MLHEGWNMTATGAAEEMEEVQHDIRKREDEVKLLTKLLGSIFHKSFVARPWFSFNSASINFVDNLN